MWTFIPWSDGQLHGPISYTFFSRVLHIFAISAVEAMSSRALRKLQGDDLGDEEDGGSGEESPPSRGGQAFNAFTLVGTLLLRVKIKVIISPAQHYELF